MILTRDNYFSREANLEYMSSSQFKCFLDCEARAMAELEGKWIEEDKTCLMQGNYVHAWSEGKLQDFINLNWSALHTQGGVLRSDFQVCEKAIKKIEKQPLFLEVLKGEKETIFTAEMFGCKWKVLIDILNHEKRRFADLKFLKDMKSKFWFRPDDGSRGFYINVFQKYGYFLSLAIYAEILRLNSDDPMFYYEPFLPVVTKEKEPDVEVVSFNSDEESHDEFIRFQLMDIEDLMPRILDVKSGKEKPVRCERCEYCIATKVLTGTKHYSFFNI